MGLNVGYSLVAAENILTESGITKMGGMWTDPMFSP